MTFGFLANIRDFLSGDGGQARAIEALRAEETKGPCAAAQEHLAAGRPIYYRHDDTPEGCVIKEYPDGRLEIVTFRNGLERPLDASSLG